MNNESFDKNAYLNLGLDELVIYAVKEVLKTKKVCTFEDMVVTCFKLFPAVFSLHGYPQYPDSLRVNKAWWRCRTDRGWLSGNVKSGFVLTPLGEKIASQVELKLHAGIVSKKKITKPRTRDEAIITHLKQHPLFNKYLADRKNFTISEGEFRSLLMCTLETPECVIKSSLNELKTILKNCDEKDLLEFIETCEKRRKTWKILKKHH